MAMQLTIPPDLDAFVRNRLSSGGFDDVEDVVRGLEAQDGETWTDDERLALDAKIDRALAQGAAALAPALSRPSLDNLVEPQPPARNS